jgi:hypothetical protein
MAESKAIRAKKHREWMRAKRAADPAGNIAYQRKWRAENRARNAFLVQRADARRRGIPFLLTFEEWWTIWHASGYWERRGKLAGQYVMARYGDVGPYALGNVRICTFGDNAREANCGKLVSQASRTRMSVAARKRDPARQRDGLGRYDSHHAKSL